MENTKKSVQKTPSKLENVSNLVSKALTSRSKWDSKDQYLDVVYWIRQVVGFIIGVFWGFLHFKGMFAILSFALVSSLIIYVYTVSFQQVDVEEYGGIWDIVKEGFMTCFSTFLVTWIVIHSSLLE